MSKPDENASQAWSNPSQDRFLEWLYGSRLGQMVLPLLIKPAITKLGGAVLNSRISRVAIKGFIRDNGIDMSQFEEREFSSYNDFFTRKIKPGARPLPEDPSLLVSPCDSVLSAYPISDNARFQVKGTRYTLRQLLKDDQLAQRFTGGTLLLFRLTVADYHRYCYAANGSKSPDFSIPGVFHTVNPLAAAAQPIYKENSRVHSVLSTSQFGDILMMEVGAMMVGKVVNEHPGQCQVQRGQEKGRFEFGGSTIILCLQKDAADIDPVYLENTQQGTETPVRYGQAIASPK